MISRQNIFIVINPEAGGGLARKLWPEVLKTLRREVGEVDFEETCAQGDGRRIAARAVRDGYVTIIACGGDGTIHEVVNGMNDAGALGPKKKLVKLGIISMGTGGDLIKTLQFPKHWKDQVALLGRSDSARKCHGEPEGRGHLPSDHWRSPRPPRRARDDTLATGPGRAKLIDIGKVTYTNSTGSQESRVFINIADAGLGADVVSRLRTTRGLFGKKLAYITATLRSYMAWKGCRMIMTIDDEEKQVLTPLSLVIANGRYFGGGMPVAPMADLSDGYFDIVIINKTNPVLSLVTAPLLYLKQHLRLPYVRTVQAKKIELTSEGPVGLDIDGEPIGTLPATFGILPKTLEVIVS